MDLDSYKKAREVFMKEHEEKYDGFTRLMLGLSVTFITLVVGLQSASAGQLSLMLKSAVVVHSLSILSGVWVQYLVMAQPLYDLKRAYKLAEEVLEEKRANPGWFERPPSQTQVVCFNVQVITFIFAFVLVVLAVVA
ncbi:membrane hypothetical protein [Pseudomonas sp. 8Z]|uniref:hypothetical protein n=1 Tax=Pseudomonas sp. 8Z TaxID=2653166 RepID=UPI0012EF0F29|nr:hypothetical protein [Pseudomonas sp. 8Z]VXD04903.1 membrane hypothetical protein [Pseudomonas sp. 8Z]